MRADVQITQGTATVLNTWNGAVCNFRDHWRKCIGNGNEKGLCIRLDGASAKDMTARYIDWQISDTRQHYCLDALTNGCGQKVDNFR